MGPAHGTLTSMFPGADPVLLQNALQVFQLTEQPLKLNQWTKKLVARPALHNFVNKIGQSLVAQASKVNGLTVKKTRNIDIFYEVQKWLKDHQGSGHTFISMLSGLEFVVLTAPRGPDPLIVTHMNFTNSWNNNGGVFLHSLATKSPVRLLSGFPVADVENLFRLFACLQGVSLDFLNSHLGDAGYSEKLLEFQLFAYFYFMTTSPFIEVPEELVQYRSLLEPYFLTLLSVPQEETAAAPIRKRKREYNFE